jgi:DNA-binding Lrp family transcriptional regulator
MVLLTPSPGREVTASEALKIPGYWLWIARCTGECNGYYSQHAVPIENRQDFVQYLDQIVSSGLATSYRIFWLGDYHSYIPNFEYYDFKKRAWRFDWPAWLSLFTKGKGQSVSEEKEASKDDFDKNDLLILKELMNDARKKLSELSELIGMTLPAAKYRFDNLARKGFLQDYVIQVLPYPPEISDLYEVRMDFGEHKTMLAKENFFKRMPFVLNYSRIKGTNSITMRVYLPRTEVNNLLTLLSALVRGGAIDRFSYMLLDPMTIQAQTFHYKAFDDKAGWSYDNQEYLAALRKLASNPDKTEPSAGAFQTPKATTVALM